MADTTNTETSTNTEAKETDALRQKLEATEQQLNNYKLIAADFENSRKRLARDAEVTKKYATEPLARDMLGALDNLDRALDAARQAGEAGPLVAGVSATASQFLDVLRRHGVTRIECGPGTPFDPNLHQAVSQKPTSDYAPGAVTDVLQHGFMIHDRVLRPAAVIVAAAE